MKLIKNHKKILVGLIIVTLLAYFQVFFFDFVNWDDDYYVLNNLQVTNPNLKNVLLFFTEGNTANYHPITMVSLMSNYILGQDNAFGYHLVNILFHIFNIVLLYNWTKNTWPTKNYLPLFVAGIFALHPMHVESVAWISSRKDVLFFFFYFLGLLWYQKYLTTKSLKSYLIILLFFTFSALSKPTAVIFSIHLLLIDYLVKRTFTIRILLEKIPFILVAVAVGLATIYVQNDAGAVSVAGYSFLERIQLASYAINLYVVKFFAPIHLSSFYPYPLKPFGMLVMLAPMFFAMLFGVIIWFFRKNQNILFGFLFFLISLVLLVQFVTVGSTIISERYTYLAYVGLSITVFFVAEKVLKLKQQTFFTIISCVLILLAFVSFNRAKVWKNGETLWTDAIEKYPQVAGSWGGRGTYYRSKKKYNKALLDFKKAIELNPNEHMFYSNRGNIYFDIGKDEEALKDYNNCLRLQKDDENALANRGAIYGRRKQYTNAIADLTNAIELKPDFVNAYMNRGIIYSQTNQRKKAKEDFKTCLTFQPQNDALWNALAIEHQYLGEFEASIIALNKAIKLKPKNGRYYFHRGISLRLLKRQKEAIKDFNKAKQLGVVVNKGYYTSI